MHGVSPTETCHPAPDAPVLLRPYLVGSLHAVPRNRHSANRSRAWTGESGRICTAVTDVPIASGDYM